jgi:hypothetical protein
MGYSSLVKRQVRNAFSTVKDLAVDITLTANTATGYNFATETATMGTPVSTVVKGIKLKEGNSKEVNSTILLEMLLISEDVPTPDIYDKANVYGFDWNIVPPFEDNGYTITLKLSRES